MLYNLLPLSLLGTFATLATAVPTHSLQERTNSTDACSIYSTVLEDIQDNMFSGGECSEEALDALRLTFHDAIAFSPALNASGKFGGGGADGSIITFSDTELPFDANVGIESIVFVEKSIGAKYLDHISYGDFIQFAGAVAIVNCAGPRVQFFHGRRNATAASPDGLVPLPEDSVSKILDRMADAGFSGSELVDLLASHSIAVQEDVDPTIPFTPFDSTPTVFDSQFYIETLLVGTAFPGDGNHTGEAKSPFKDEFRLLSDHLIARDPRTACHWQSLITDQETMAMRFKKAMEKLAIVGHDKKSLVDCSHMVPEALNITLPAPHIPAGKTIKDIEASCPETPFPTLTADSGPETSIPPVPPSDDGDNADGTANSDAN